VQFLYQLFPVATRPGFAARCVRQAVFYWLAGCLLAGLSAQAQAPVEQAKLLTEVGKWVQQTQQLTPEQFSFAPMDSRVQLQSCDRALLMDLPFASRETVRVRCLGSASWQLYLRLVFKSVIPTGVTSVTSVTPLTSAAASAGPSPAAVGRKVVVGKVLLRAGTVVTPDVLTEVEHSGQGLDSQVVSSVKDLENAEMVRDVPAGTPLRSHDLRRTVLVKQGQMILLSVGAAGGFAITARVEALQDGRMGDQVRLKNAESGRFMTGVVTGPNAARGL